MRLYKTDVIEIRKKMAEQKIKMVTELSKRSGINRITLAKILNEEKQPSSDAMEKLVFSLKMNPYEAGAIFFKTALRDT